MPDPTEKSKEELANQAIRQALQVAIGLPIVAAVTIGVVWLLMSRPKPEPIVNTSCPAGQVFADNWKWGVGAFTPGLTIYTGPTSCKTEFGKIVSVDPNTETAMVDRGEGAVEMKLRVLEQEAWFSR